MRTLTLTITTSCLTPTLTQNQNQNRTVTLTLAHSLNPQNVLMKPNVFLRLVLKSKFVHTRIEIHAQCDLKQVGMLEFSLCEETEQDEKKRKLTERHAGAFVLLRGRRDAAGGREQRDENRSPKNAPHLPVQPAAIFLSWRVSAPPDSSCSCALTAQKG